MSQDRVDDPSNHMFILNTRDGEKIPFNSFTMKIGELATVSETIAKDPFKLIEERPIPQQAPKVLKILLGTMCNYRCSYCRQSVHVPNGDVQWSQKHSSFIHMLMTYTDLTDLQRVEYWGGEPLLYWKVVKKMIETFNRITGNSVVHHITTNGSRLTKDKADFLVNQPGGLDYKLSYDGPGNGMRSGNPLETGSKSRQANLFINEYCRGLPRKNFYVNTVVTVENLDVPGIITHMKEVFCDPYVQLMKMEPVIPYNEDAIRHSISGNYHLKNLEDKLFDAICHGGAIHNVREYQELWGSFEAMSSNPLYRYNPNEAKCHVSQQTTLTTDIDGNIYPCQVYNSDTPGQHLGNIVSFGSVNSILPHPVSSREKCLSCPVVSMCRGVCPHIPPGKEANINCSTRYHTYMGIMKAFFKLYGLDVESITKK